MVNTQKYGMDHFQPPEGQQPLREASRLLPEGTRYVNTDDSTTLLVNQWKTLQSTDPDTVGQTTFLETRKELIAALKARGIDPAKI